MESWIQCDMCHGKYYTPDNPFVEGRQRRPSVPSEFSCVIAGHLRCVVGRSVKVDILPEIGDSGGFATPSQWKQWLESQAARASRVSQLG